MIFREVSRVIYENNPLQEVLCQLKFPPILRIASEIPAAYQEKIRKEYPFVEETSAEPGLPPGLPLEIRKLIQSFSIPTEKAFGFVSADRHWKVSLNKEFVALSTTQYVRWEDFKQHLATPLEALAEHYAPPFFTRVGLRYRDLIVRSKLGLEGRNWDDLLEPYIAGELAENTITSCIERADRDLLIRIPEANSKIHIRHGLVGDKQKREPCYYIDSDFFTDERVKTNDILGTLDRFNGEAGRFFRWCIRDVLHAAMGPKSV
jgi:uncharacterized protein (TIGR04255 family)